jgi:hypothetical protein
MAYGDNAIEPLYEPGGRLTGRCTAAVTGGRFVRISAAPSSGPALNTSADGSNISVAHCGAAGKAIGVAGWDGPSVGDKIAVLARPGMIVPMTAGGTVAVGAEVESDANGKADTLASGRPNGLAITAGVNDGTIYVRLY